MKHINNFDVFLNETENLNSSRELTVHFHECEHGGDLDNYINDLQDSGARVLNSSYDSEEETGTVKISVKDFAAFLAKFKETDSIGFSSLDAR